MARQIDLTQEYLKSVLDYNAETGVFTWKIRDDVNKSWNTKYSGKEAKWNHSSGYLQSCINYKKYYLHRLAWFYVYGEWPKEIDHKDLDKKNNRISNLREVTHLQNTYNRLDGKNTSGYKGVAWLKRDKRWRASIAYNKKNITIGYFDCPELAHLAYCEAAALYHGEFARTA